MCICDLPLLPPRPSTSFDSSTMQTNFFDASSTICASLKAYSHWHSELCYAPTKDVKYITAEVPFLLPIRQPHTCM